MGNHVRTLGPLHALLAGAWLMSGAVVMAQKPGAKDALNQHLSGLKQQAEDSSLPIGQREALVLEMVAALDREAQAATEPQQRQTTWDRAISLLDDFNKLHPGHPRSREFQLRAGVYRWAEAQGWRNSGDLNPADPRPAKEAATALDDAIRRFREIAPGEGAIVLADNVRFRLARALADRADLEPAGASSRTTQENEALELLKEPMTEPGLRGFSALLRADLLCRAGRLDEAAKSIEAARKEQPAPTDRELLEAEVELLEARKKPAEAIEAINKSSLADPVKHLMVVEVRLERLAGLPKGDERLAEEKAMLQGIESIRKQNSPEARRALVALGRPGLELDERHDPAAWDLLAEARQIRGDTAGAGALEERAAERAEATHQPEAAAGYRLRGGGFLYQAGKYAEADSLLSQVAQNPNAGANRAKAGLLRALARGRALAAGSPGVTAGSYADALQWQIGEFPADPVTDEARWLLGTLENNAGEVGRAEALWKQIAAASPRWLDSRLALAGLQRAAVDAQLLIGDRTRMREEYVRANTFLEDCIKQAHGESAVAELLIAQIRLNLVPIAGRPALARELSSRLGRMELNANQRYRGRLLRLIALVQVGPPYLEAEREAQSHANWSDPAARTAFLDAVRLLDACASYSEDDLRQRRVGLVMRLLIQPATVDLEEDKWSAEERAEFKLRLARAFLFLGDERNAQAALRTWPGPPRRASDSLLRDLADSYERLEAYELAIDVQRLRVKNLASGSPGWFEARYGLALAYFHAGRLKEAAHLIDATGILHPDLGGGAIEKKFIRLRQRIGMSP
jgi:thioredoxin-like negative regulator of GroEL